MKRALRVLICGIIVLSIFFSSVAYAAENGGTYWMAKSKKKPKVQTGYMGSGAKTWQNGGYVDTDNNVSILNSIETANADGVIEQQESRFVYRLPDGSLMKPGYAKVDIDGDGYYEFFYFGEDGYLVVNGVAPNGYTVDANGLIYDPKGMIYKEVTSNKKYELESSRAEKESLDALGETKIAETAAPEITKFKEDLPAEIVNVLNSTTLPMDRRTLRGKLMELGWIKEEIDIVILEIDWLNESIKFAKSLYAKDDSVTEEDIKKKMKMKSFDDDEIDYALIHCGIEW